MSHMDEDVSPGAVWVVAVRTIRAHGPRRDGTPGRCPHCPPVGECENLRWAIQQRQQLEESAAARLAAGLAREVPPQS